MSKSTRIRESLTYASLDVGRERVGQAVPSRNWCEIVDSIFRLHNGHLHAFTLLGYAETYSILRRRFNAGHFSSRDYAEAQTALDADILENSNVYFLTLEDKILTSIPPIERYNINSSDAAILAAYLDYRDSIPRSDGPSILVAYDHRLLRAAASEGLIAIDPETMIASDLPAFISAL